MSIIDFGDRALNEAALYEAPFEYVREHVRPMRLAGRRAKRAERWWQHGETVPGLHKALDSLSRYIATPRVAKHRLFVWVTGGTLPDSAVVAVARDDDYTLGVLHSRVHEAWALAMGTQLEARPRYTPSTTFETFPFPEPTPEQRARVGEAARRLVELRDGWLNPPGIAPGDLSIRTLTNLYNERPTWLAQAHDSLDRTVLAAYGWPVEVDDGALLEHLLALNLARSGKGTARTHVPGDPDGAALGLEVPA